MVAISEVEAACVPAEQIDALNDFIDKIRPSDLRSFLAALLESVQEGHDVALFGADADLTPNEVSQRLKMSRTHLYKLLDSGAIPSHRVGRDRRIALRDVIMFEQKRRRDREELATRFAQTAATRAGAIDELLNEA